MAEPASSSSSHLWLLALLMVASFALRSWYAWPEAHQGRFWDERFNVNNINRMVHHHTLRPQNFYYGGLSYQPQAGVLAASRALERATGASPFATDPRSSGAYRFYRLSNVFYGTLSLALLFLLGRALFGPATGLLAALLLAASPRHIHSSAIFKPDILLLALTVLALLWMCRAAAANTHRTYVLAGLGAGLAAAAKLNGFTVLGPLVLASLLTWKDLRRWSRLALATAVSGAVFLVFNPWPREVLEHLLQNRVHYEHFAAGGPPAVLRATAGFLFAPEFHGPWIALLALAGAALLAWTSLHREVARDRRLSWWMLLSYPAVYYATYVVVTERAKANHFLQILPFTSLTAAFAVVSLARVAARRWPMLRRSAARLAGSAALVAVLAATSFGFAYESLVPSTEELAIRWLERRLPPPATRRLVLQEAPVRLDRHRWKDGRPYLATEPSLGQLSTGELELGDAYAFPADRLYTDEAGAYLLLSVDAESERFAPSWFGARGRELVVLLRPWRTAWDGGGIPMTLAREGPHRWSASLDPPWSWGEGDVVSIEARLPRGGERHAPEGITVHVGDRPVRLDEVDRTRRDFILLSRRFRWSVPTEQLGRIVLEVPGAPQSLEAGEIMISVDRWSRAELR